MKRAHLKTVEDLHKMESLRAYQRGFIDAVNCKPVEEFPKTAASHVRAGYKSGHARGMVVQVNEARAIATVLGLHLTDKQLRWAPIVDRDSAEEDV